MKMHVLAGDSLVAPFQETAIDGEIIVCRECLVDGDLRAGSLEEFWSVRDEYLSRGNIKPDGFYREKVKSEFVRLIENADEAEINLWFEYELFCQVNFWFCLSLLAESKSDIYIVYPFIHEKKDIWKGFSFLDKEDLQKSFDRRIKLSEADVSLGNKLWEAFQNRDSLRLSELCKSESAGFPSIKEVCDAAATIEDRPKRKLQQIVAEKGNNFGDVFREFNQREAIYGFGNLQVKKIFDEII